MRAVQPQVLAFWCLDLNYCLFQIRKERWIKLGNDIVPSVICPSTRFDWTYQDCFICELLVLSLREGSNNNNIGKTNDLRGSWTELTMVHFSSSSFLTVRQRSKWFTIYSSGFLKCDWDNWQLWERYHLFLKNEHDEKYFCA